MRPAANVKMGAAMPAASPGNPAVNPGEIVPRSRWKVDACKPRQVIRNGDETIEDVNRDEQVADYKDLPYPWPLQIKQIGRICGCVCNLLLRICFCSMLVYV
jgi:hypothetical protein